MSDDPDTANVREPTARQARARVYAEGDGRGRPDRVPRAARAPVYATQRRQVMGHASD